MSDVIDGMIDEAKYWVERSAGGMEEYLETLQDSDTFYNDAYSRGVLAGLERVKRALEIEEELDKVIGTGMVHEEFSEKYNLYTCDVVYIEEYLMKHNDRKARKHIKKLLENKDG